MNMNRFVQCVIVVGNNLARSPRPASTYRAIFRVQEFSVTLDSQSCLGQHLDPSTPTCADAFDLRPEAV